MSDRNREQAHSYSCFRFRQKLQGGNEAHWHLLCQPDTIFGLIKLEALLLHLLRGDSQDYHGSVALSYG